MGEVCTLLCIPLIKINANSHFNGFAEISNKFVFSVFPNLVLQDCATQY